MMLFTHFAQVTVHKVMKLNVIEVNFHMNHWSYKVERIYYLYNLLFLRWQKSCVFLTRYKSANKQVDFYIIHLRLSAMNLMCWWWIHFFHMYFYLQVTIFLVINFFLLIMVLPSHCQYWINSCKSIKQKKISWK